MRERGGDEITLPDFIDWPRFRRFFEQHWRVGPPDWPNPNVALVGRAGSGKTTLAREILRMRDRVVVFDTKDGDPSLEAFEREGYIVVRKFDVSNTRQPRVIFRPPLDAQNPHEMVAAVARQRTQIQAALWALFRAGGWTAYFDEIRYLSETLKLQVELNQLWLQGRSKGTVIVAATQRPVSVPINMFEQSPHLFAWRITGLEDRRTMASYAGAQMGVVVATAAILPRYEFLYVDSIEDLAIRSRVTR